MTWKWGGNSFNTGKRRGKGGCSGPFIPFSGFSMPPMKIAVANFIYASDIIFTLSLGPWMEVWKSYLEVSSSFSTPTCTQRNPSQTPLAHPQRSHMCTYEHMDRQAIKMPSGSQSCCSHRCVLRQTVRVLAFSHPCRHADPRTDAMATPTTPYSAVTFPPHALFEHRTSPVRTSQVHLRSTKSDFCLCSPEKTQLLNGAK